MNTSAAYLHVKHVMWFGTCQNRLSSTHILDIWENSIQQHLSWMIEGIYINRFSSMHGGGEERLHQVKGLKLTRIGKVTSICTGCVNHSSASWCFPKISGSFRIILKNGVTSDDLNVTGGLTREILRKNDLKLSQVQVLISSCYKSSEPVDRYSGSRSFSHYSHDFIHPFRGDPITRN